MGSEVRRAERVGDGGGSLGEPLPGFMIFGVEGRDHYRVGWLELEFSGAGFVLFGEFTLFSKCLYLEDKTIFKTPYSMVHQVLRNLRRWKCRRFFNRHLTIYKAV